MVQASRFPSMRRIFIFGSLLLLIAAAQMAAQSDLFDVSTTAASSVRSHVVQSANPFASGVAITPNAPASLRAAHLPIQGKSLRLEKTVGFNLLCVLRC